MKSDDNKNTPKIIENSGLALDKTRSLLGITDKILSKKNQLTTETERFIIHNNGTVTDKQTGLMWKRCAEGQTGDDCNGGEAQKFTWDEAMKHAVTVNANGGFAGYEDWRVPTTGELDSITDFYYRSIIDSIVFPNTPRWWFWSSQSRASDNNYAWNSDFREDCYFDEEFTNDHKLSNNHVRLVRC